MNIHSLSLKPLLVLSLGAIVFGSAVAINVAPLGTATQISDWTPDTTADKAIDGNRDGRFSSGSVQHTNSHFQAWWQVELDQSYVLHTINVWNRVDGWDGRLSPFTVTVFSGDNVTWSMSGIQFVENIDDGLEYTLGMAIDLGQVNGDRVRINLDGTNWLHMGEVEVLAVPEPGTLLAIGAGVALLARRRKKSLS